MPFQSEKQRRYLWANEPEIAREWTDRYGARGGGIMDMASDGNLIHDFKNHTNSGRNVSVPRSFQARSHSTPVNLSYITDEEAGILQALKPGTPHRGPMEIPNYDDYDPQGGYRSGPTMSGIETGAKNERARADRRAAGISPQEAAGIRGGAVAAGAQSQQGRFGGLKTGFFGGLKNMFGKLRGWNEKEARWNTQQEWQNAQNLSRDQKRMGYLSDRKSKGLGYGRKAYSNLLGRGIKDPFQDAINRDLQINPETTQFARSHLQSLANKQALTNKLSANNYNFGYQGVNPSSPEFGGIMSTPQGTAYNNPVGGVDQFAKEVAALERSAYPIGGTKYRVDKLPGTLQDYYRNKIPSSITGYKYADKGLPGHSRINVTQPYSGTSTVNDPYANIEDHYAFKPGSMLDKKLKSAWNTYNETGFGLDNVKTLMEMDIKSNEEKGIPLSLDKSAYSLIG